MEKGKLIDNRKFFTLMVVPHSTDKVYALKVSSGIYMSIIVLLAFLCILSIFLIFHNGALNIQVASYNSTFNRLNEDIKSRDSKISALENELSAQKAQIDDISQSLSEMDELAASIRAFSSSRGSLSSRGSESSGSTLSGRNNSMVQLSLDELKDVADSLKTEFCELSGVVGDIKDYIESKPSLWPTNSGRVTSVFGYRRDPVTGYRNDFHPGLDIANVYGAPVYAAGKGTITSAGYRSGYGYCITISHGYGITSLYAHLSQILVKSGKKVSKGEVIGKVGSSGKSTGSHLHIEIAMNRRAVNPYIFLK